jgi:beta-galactosidase
VLPLEEEEYDLGVKEYTNPGEYTITVSFVLKEDTLWAKKGYEICFGQTNYKIAQEKVEISLPIHVIDDIFTIGVRGSDFHIMFSRQYGGIISYRYAGKEMLSAIPKPNFWRAPTDNDRGNQMTFRYAQWKIASLYPKVEEVIVENYDTYAVVKYVLTLPTSIETKVYVTYTVLGDGKIITKLEYQPIEGVGGMPEFGMIFKMPADYENVEWYGFGPAENYCDRQKGSRLGLFKNKVVDNVSKYVIPQECGNKTEVRFIKIVDSRGRGLLFEGDKMEVSALPYTPHEIENAFHHFELPQIHHTVIKVAKQQMGVGGDDSWGAFTHPEYLIDTKHKLVFEFAFIGIL